MATNYFLVINGIAGDYHDSLLSGAFQVTGFGLDTGSGDLFQPLALQLNTGTLAALLAAEAGGTPISNVSLVGESTAGGVTAITYSLNLADVTIADVSAASSQGPQVTLDYEQIGVVTRAQDTKGGLAAPQTFGWDVVNNVSTGPGTSLTNAGPAVPPTAPTTYYLLVDGVNGGSTASGHVGWFQLSNFSIDLAAGTFSDLSVTTAGEAGLTALLQLEATSAPVTGVRVEGVTSTGTAIYDLNLAGVHVDSVVNSSSSGVQINFDYNQVSLVTKAQDSKGGLRQTGSFGYDLTTHQSIDPATMPSISAGPNHGAVAPTSYFLVIDGIAGDYKDTLLNGAFKVASFNSPQNFAPLGLQLNGETLAGLLAAAAPGTPIDHVSLVGESTVSGVQKITYSLNLSDVTFNKVAEPDSTQGIEVVLDYNQIGLVTTGQDAKGGLTSPQTFGWDVVNKVSTGPGTSLTNAGTTFGSTTPTTYYLLVNGVNGGSTASGHAGWFQLSNFSIDLAAGTFSDLSVTTASEAGLTALLQLEATGAPVTGVRVEGVTSTGQAIYDLNLADVHVTSVDNLSTSSVNLTFDYNQVSLVTKAQDSKGGLSQTGSFGWDLTTSKSIDPATMPSISAGPNHGAVAPTSYYLVIDNIAGDYRDTLLRGAFKVASFDLPTLTGNSFGPLGLTLSDQTLAGLLAAAVPPGTPIDHVSLVGESTSGVPEITYSLNLSDVTFNNVSDDGRQGLVLTLGYDQIGLVTTGQDAKGGLTSPQTFGWDVANNTSAGPGTSLTNAGVSTVPTTPTTYYLLVDQVHGGSTDPNHRDWFQLADFRYNLAANGNFGNLFAGTVDQTGLAALLDLEATGADVTGVRIEGVNSNGQAVYDLNLVDAHVTTVNNTSPGVIAIDFDYSKIALVTEGQDSKGLLARNGVFGWDLVANKAFDPTAHGALPNIAPCYCPGTLILTERGEVTVEDLAIGDTVMTLSGAARPIKWIGRRAYSGRFAQGQKHILPVCIKAGAIDDEVPRRDLWISPHHAMYLDGVLIEAKDLVNGITIVQATNVERVEYFHIELETHDVLIAEGSLSESFVDDDDRGMFHNAHEFASLYPAEASGPARYCAPRCDQGYEVEAVRRRLEVRAGLQTANNGPGKGELRGYVDWIGFDRIAGWAQNVDHPEAPVCLDIYVDGALIGQTLANRYRSDLEQAGLGSGRHSFEFVPPAGLKFAADTVEVRRSLDHAVLAVSHADQTAAAA